MSTGGVRARKKREKRLYEREGEAEEQGGSLRASRVVWRACKTFSFFGDIPHYSSAVILYIICFSCCFLLYFFLQYQ